MVTTTELKNSGNNILNFSKNRYITLRQQCAKHNVMNAAFLNSVIHISSVVHEHLGAGSVHNRKLGVVLPLGAGFIQGCQNRFGNDFRLRFSMVLDN